MTRAYVGVGANLGDATANVCAAIGALGRLPRSRVAQASSLYRSAPVDAEGPSFVNAAVALETELQAHELLAALHDLERQFGRVRTVRNAPRALDLDLLLHGGERRADATLVLPHPRLHERAFVLRPLLEIAPELEAPGLGPLSRYLAGVSDQSIERLT